MTFRAIGVGMVSILAFITLGLFSSCSTPARADGPAVGDAAPAFVVLDSYGNEHSLAEYAGKYVVLEWTGFGCPFVGKHYESGNMQALQARWTSDDVIWLSIVSSAPGKQGYFPPEEMNEQFSSRNSSPSAILMDPSGEVGLAYGARTTPNMFVIDPSGTLIYMGAIDDRPTSDLADVEGAFNYVSAALEESMAGNPVEIPLSTPYGCGVKY